MDDPVLYIKLYSPDIFTEFCSEEELRLIVQVTGITPSVFVYVEITGRHPGREEVLELVKELSSRFKGYGFDEYSSYDYFWTLEEIKDGVPKEGFLFFDYLARYKAEKKKSQPDR